jgi:glycosyltransferase involved in cell wall biosynthesis
MTGLAELDSDRGGAPVSAVAQSAERAHVLFLIDQLCRKGGAEGALLNMVRWLPADRFRCSVMTFRTDSNLPLLAEFPCRVQVLPLQCSYGWNALRTGLRLARFIRREKVDIVHTFFPSSDLWGGIVAKLSRRPILISSRRDMGFLRGARHRVAYRALQGMFDGVLAVSEQVRKVSIEQDGLAPGRVKTIYNAVDPERLRASVVARDVRERLGLGDASHVIASVGNLRRVKGFDVLLRAAALVCREYPGAVFVVAGGEDPAEAQGRRDLEALSSALGIAGKVRFVGPLDDVVPLLKASNVFCLLSRSEGFSNALVEAMACGLPCVATRVGGNGEAIEDGRSGFLVESEDHAAAAARILELLRDPVRAIGIGENAQTVVARRFTPRIVTAQLVELYEKLLADRGRQG